jgi:hypothetical protein
MNSNKPNKESIHSIPTNKSYHSNKQVIPFQQTSHPMQLLHPVLGGMAVKAMAYALGLLRK